MWVLLGRYFCATIVALLPVILMLASGLNQQPKSANNSGKKISRTTVESAIKQWEQGEYLSALDNMQSLASSQKEAELYHFYFSRVIQDDLAFAFSQQNSLSSNCQQQLLFVAGDVESLQQAENVRQTFQNDERLHSLPICIHPLIWFDPSGLNCAENTDQNTRISCDLATLSQRIKSQEFTHLVVFAPSGKANVHNGIMFLDVNDTYDVFVHELAHFAGFVDEYPLSKELAKNVCSGVDAPNLAFSPTDIRQVDLAYWQSMDIDPGMNLVKAKTCDNHPSQAYKVSNKLTFMEYHDVAHIPLLYLKAWEKSLVQPMGSPSAHVNFAQYYEQQNNKSESIFWRQKYQAYLAN